MKLGKKGVGLKMASELVCSCKVRICLTGGGKEVRSSRSVRGKVGVSQYLTSKQSY